MWTRRIALVLGVVMLLFGALVVVVFVSGAVGGDAEITGNVQGFVVLSALTLAPGVALVRSGRKRRSRVRAVGQGGAEMSEAHEAGSTIEWGDAESLRNAARADRRRAWRHVILLTLVVLAAVVLSVVATTVFDLSPTIVALFNGGLIFALITISTGERGWNRHSKTEDVSWTVDTGAGGPQRFGNIAFSVKRPWLFGWSRDVGILTIDRDHLAIAGLKGAQVIRAPFAAELHDNKYMYWTMVRVTGSGGSDHATTTYLVVRGAPRSKFAADRVTIAQESARLANAINRAREA